MEETNNNKKCLYLTFIVDRSGSMMSCGDSVFEGISSCIDKKKKLAKELDMSICLTIFTFDDVIKRLDIPSDPTKLNFEHYDIIQRGIEPRGWTRLYDAVHQAAAYTTELQDKQGHQTSRGFMVILTDGEDNQSDISHEDLKKEIESHKKTGMEYIFIGANVNAKHTGSTLGISKNACMQFTPDPKLTQTAFTNLGMAIQRSIETDDGEFQFSQVERLTSCTASDYNRFQVNDGLDSEPEPDDVIDIEVEVEAEAEEELPTMEEILRKKQPTYWSRNKNVFETECEDIFNTRFNEDIFAKGVNNLLNLSFTDVEEKTGEEAEDEVEVGN